MKVYTKQKQVEYKEYVAENGKIFNTSEECIRYEKSLKNLVPIYVVMDAHFLCTSFICAMSTKEKAQDWIDTYVLKMAVTYNKDVSGRYSIVEKFIDEYMLEK